MTFLLLGGFADATLVDAVTGMATATQPAQAEGGDDGLAVTPDTQSAADRILYFAAVHGAAPVPGHALIGAARIGVTILVPTDAPLAGQRFGAAPLSDHWASIWREAAREIMGYHGQRAPAEVMAGLNTLWVRAASRVRGQAAERRRPTKFGAADVRRVSVDRPYAKYFAVEDMVYDHATFTGGRSGPLTRAVFVTGDAVTVLPYDPVRDRVLVIVQIRAAPVARHDTSPWLMEPVAGRIEPGDTPEATAHKETSEEARITLSALHKIAEYYPSTGAFSEYLYSYIGIADLPDGTATLGGLETENEDIQGHLMSRADLMALVAADEVPVGPLLLSALWLDANAERLSSES